MGLHIDDRDALAAFPTVAIAYGISHMEHLVELRKATRLWRSSRRGVGSRTSRRSALPSGAEAG